MRVPLITTSVCLELSGSRFGGGVGLRQTILKVVIWLALPSFHSPFPAQCYSWYAIAPHSRTRFSFQLRHWSLTLDAHGLKKGAHVVCALSSLTAEPFKLNSPDLP